MDPTKCVHFEAGKQCTEARTQGMYCDKHRSRMQKQLQQQQSQQQQQQQQQQQ